MADVTSRATLTTGALLAAAGVALGAFGAHGLEGRIEAWGYAHEMTQRVAWFDTGVRYHLLHALGLVLAAMLSEQPRSPRSARVAAIAFVVGILLFSGSLYAMTMAPPSWSKLGAVVPIGGLSFIVGWMAMAYAGWRS